MEKIFKKVCTYKSKSHNQGLLPYIVNGQIIYQDSAHTDGNWGQYVCDFGYISKNNIEGYDEFFDNLLINENGEKVWQYRYKYANLMLQYNYIAKAIRKGIIVKKNKKIDKVLWVSKFNDIVDRYNYAPHNISDFKAISDYEYEYIGDEKLPDSEFMILLDDNNDDITTKILDYNKIWIKWKKLVHSDTYDTPYWDISKSVENDYIGLLYVPLYIKGDKVPTFLQYSDINEWYKWFYENQKLSGECCTNKEWEDRGGKSMWDFLSNESILNLFLNKLKDIEKWEDFSNGEGKKYLAPYLDFNIFLDEEYKDYGLLTIYEDEFYTPEIDNSIKGHFVEMTDGGKIESQLELVRYDKYIYDDNGVLPGILERSDGSILKVSANGIEGNINNNSLTSCDEIEKALNNQLVYYPALIFEEVQEYLKQNNLDGFVNVLPFYKTPLKIPYKEGIAYNVSSISDKCYGDYIISIKYPNENLIEINYNIGGNVNCVDSTPIIDDSVEKHGMTLRETYAYYPNSKFKIKINGTEFEIDYEKIDFESSMTSATTPDLGIVREDVLLAEVTGLFVDDLSGITKSILFKKENMNRLSFQPLEDINIEMNRGSAAAFEPHFKLSECNTMEDLENYGNNYFNL